MSSDDETPPTPDGKGDKPVHITVDPMKLEFDASKVGQKIVKLKNTHTTKVMFKIKTNDNKKYKLNPVFGEIDVGQTTEIKVDHKVGPAKENKIVIVHSESTGEKDLAKSFKTANITGRDIIVKLTDKPAHITVDPSELVFYEKGQKIVKLKNTHTKKVMFKLKKSNDGKHWVNKKFGEIDVGQTVEVKVEYKVGPAKENKIVIVHSESTVETEISGKSYDAYFQRKWEIEKAFNTSEITGKDVIVKLVDNTVQMTNKEKAKVDTLVMLAKRFEWKVGDDVYDEATRCFTEMAEFIKSMPNFENHRYSAAQFRDDLLKALKIKKGDEKDVAPAADAAKEGENKEESSSSSNSTKN